MKHYDTIESIMDATDFVWDRDPIDKLWNASTSRKTYTLSEDDTGFNLKCVIAGHIHVPYEAHSKHADAIVKFIKQMES